jgi:hypothetical protein
VGPAAATIGFFTENGFIAEVVAMKPEDIAKEAVRRHIRAVHSIPPPRIFRKPKRRWYKPWTWFKRPVELKEGDAVYDLVKWWWENQMPYGIPPSWDLGMKI